MPKVYGYLRVSTDKGQTTDNQKLEILNAGYANAEWFADEAVSGTIPAFDRPKFKQMIENCQSGDTIVISKIDRLGRNSVDTLQTINNIERLGVSLVVLQLGKVDLASPVGKLMLKMLTAVAEMERDLIVERVNAGLERAKAEGVELGAPVTIEPEILEQMIQERQSGRKLKEIATKFGMHTSRVDRNVKQWAGRMEEYTKKFMAQQKQAMSRQMFA